MRFEKIDPPGTFCNNEALRNVVRLSGGKTFIEIGCGDGHVSKFLCSIGLSGIGVDFSKRALEAAQRTLAPEIAVGRYRLVEGDATDASLEVPKSDIAVSYMVMEHVHDDTAFVQQLGRFVRPGGMLIIAVPGRMDRWSIEDDTVGHLRRYEREDLQAVLERGRLGSVRVWSVAVPVANLLFGLSNYVVKRSAEVQKLGQSQREQTETSGIRDIPWKTVFPSWVKIILNRYTLFPLFVIQRWFYNTPLGLTMVGFGRVGDEKAA